MCIRDSYRAGDEYDVDQGWKLADDNISQQVQILSLNGYKGFGLFNYSSLSKKSAIKEMDELLRVLSLIHIFTLSLLL